jgi:hypothetical protein
MLKQILELNEQSVNVIIEQINAEDVLVQTQDQVSGHIQEFCLNKTTIRVFIGVLLKYQADLNKNV